MVPHPNARSVDMVVQLKNKNLPFIASQDGKNTATLWVLAASQDQYGRLLASRIQRVRVITSLQTAAERDKLVTPLSISIPFPRKAKDVRVVVECVEGGRMGSLDVPIKLADAASAEVPPAP